MSLGILELIVLGGVLVAGAALAAFVIADRMKR